MAHDEQALLKKLARRDPSRFNRTRPRSDHWHATLQHVSPTLRPSPWAPS